MSVRRSLAAFAVIGLGSPFAFAQVSVGLVAIEGGTLLGGGAGTVTNLNTPSVNGLGQVGFTGAITTGVGTATTNFVFVNDKITLRNIDVGSPVLTGAETQMGLSDTGGFIFSPSADGADAVFTHNGLLLRDGDAAPGFPGQFNSFNSRPLMAADGTAFWVAGNSASAGGTTTQRVLYKATPSGGTFTISSFLAGGGVVGSVTTTAQGISFDYDVSDNAAFVIGEGSIAGATTATDTFVYLNNSVIAREGDAIGSSTWQNFRHNGVNNAGNYIIYGDDASTVDDIIVYNGAVGVRQGDVVAGLTLGSTVDGAAINNLNQVVHIWDLVGTQPNEALFFGNGAALGSSSLLLRTGDLIDTTGDSVADYTLVNFLASTGVAKGMDFGDDGRVFVEVELTPIGGTGVLEAIIAVTIPEPAGIGLIAAAGLLGLRRRR